jgi:hypothetical protein
MTTKSKFLILVFSFMKITIPNFPEILAIPSEMKYEDGLVGYALYALHRKKA